MEHQFETDVFRGKLGKLPDLEKLLAKLYTYSVKHRVKAIYFENVSLNKLREFRQVQKHLRQLDDLVGSLVRCQGMKSDRLWELLTPVSDGGLYPEGIKEAIDEFDSMIVWKKTQNAEEEIPEPQPGLDEDFDRCNKRVDDIKLELEQVLNETRKEFKDARRINWSHAKYRYELEIPSEYVEGKKKPQNFEFTSQRQGYQRFHTKQLKQLIDKLETAEETL